jgi:hypothetical protein
MTDTLFFGRRASRLSNEHLEVIVTIEGGHIAAIRDLATGVSPLWKPPWPSIEPSSYDRARHPEYGDNAESRLLAGILGHNLCLDLFGAPSEEEAAAGMIVHGEAGAAVFDVEAADGELTQRALLPNSQLGFERTIRLRPGSRRLEIRETVENLSCWDRPIAWTQHVTLGPPFLEKGKTLFRATAARSKVIEHDFTGGKGHLQVGAEFDWPWAPCVDGSREDLRVFTSRPVSGAFTTHLMDPGRQRAWFVAWHPDMRLALGYAWRREDFPWLGIWEENFSRTAPPWNGATLTRGMEFGVSPFPECRRAMIERGGLFGVPGYRWIPARTRVTVDYEAWLAPAESIEAACPVD